jgi:hypothetical protein
MCKPDGAAAIIDVRHMTGTRFAAALAQLFLEHRMSDNGPYFTTPPLLGPIETTTPTPVSSGARPAPAPSQMPSREPVAALRNLLWTANGPFVHTMPQFLNQSREYFFPYNPAPPFFDD